MQNWWYAKGGERRGPVSLQQLQELAASGEVAATDLVWTKGMAQWQPMKQVADAQSSGPAVVAAPAPTPTPPSRPPMQKAPPPAMPAAFVPQPAPVQSRIETPRPIADDNGEEAISNVASPVPSRAVNHLKGHGVPTGDIVNWPISDEHFTELRRSLEIRRLILSASNVYQVMLLLGLIAGFLLAAAAIIPMMSTASGAQAQAIALVIGGVVLAAGSAVVGVCARFTRRSHQWAPMTIFILCISLLLLMGYLTFEGLRGPYASSSLDIVVQICVGVSITATVLITFAIISWRAWSAIPRYRNQPAWCQELIAAAGI